MLTDHLTSAAADAAAVTDTNGRDRARVLPLAGLALAGMLALTACSGDSEVPDDDGSVAAESESPHDSAAPTDGSSPSGESSADDSQATDSESATEDGDSEGSRSRGEHVAASEEGPAQNVPDPEVPESIVEKTEDGVEAAVEYFWAADSYLVSTGDPEPLESVSSDTCNFCAEEVDYFTTIYSEGSWYVSTPDEVTNIDPSLTGDNSAEAVMSMNSTASAMYYDDRTEAGSEETTYNMGWIMNLEHTGDHWIVTEATVIEGSGSKSASEGAESS